MSLHTVFERLSRHTGAPREGLSEARVIVRGGYEPDTIYGVAGRALRITFRREESALCSERVVFPAFGRAAMLPPFTDVVVELLPERPGEYEFTCQMGMLRGRVIVVPGGESGERERVGAGTGRAAPGDAG